MAGRAKPATSITRSVPNKLAVSKPQNRSTERPKAAGKNVNLISSQDKSYATSTVPIRESRPIAASASQS